MIRFGKGGANTNKNGKKFEKSSSMMGAFENNPDYVIDGKDLYKKGNYIGTFYNQQSIMLLADKLKVDRSVWTSEIWPDGALYVPSENRLYISESKAQNGRGSVDSKPWGFPGLKWKYEILFGQAGTDVKFCGVYSKHFMNDRFGNMFTYIGERGIDKFFYKIDLGWFEFSGKEMKEEQNMGLW